MNPRSAFKAPQGLLRSLVLAYASKYPITGAELAVEIRNRTAGLWDPSPGSVYFLMNELKDKGLLSIVGSREGGRKSYIATEAGRVELNTSSGKAMATLERELTLLALLVSMIRPMESERMETLKSLLKADPAVVARVKAQLK